MVTSDQLLKIMPYAKTRVPAYLDMLNRTMDEFEINSRYRQAAYLAQIAHESGELRYVEELASGAAYDTGAKAKALGNTPEADGDGQLYKGHGLIQITGKANHQLCADYFNKSMDEIVPWLKTPEGATRSSGWFWYEHNLNKLADLQDFVKITKVINGGVNGLDARLAYYNKAMVTL